MSTVELELSKYSSGKINFTSNDEAIIERELKYLELLVIDRKEIEESVAESKGDKSVSKVIRKSQKREVKFLALEAQKLATNLLNKGVHGSIISGAVINAGRNGRIVL